MSSFIGFKEIIEEQKKPLPYKIEKAVEAIRKGFSLSKHHTALAFSGGKDSTVLWHLIRTYCPEQAESMHVIFGNTGVEYPESLQFARKLGKDWGGDHFHETKLLRTEQKGLKYAAQREVLEWLRSEGSLSEVLKADGKLKSTQCLERAATPEMWADFEKRGLVWPKNTPMSYWWCADQYGFPILGKAASKLDARRINIDCFLEFSKSSSEKDELHEYYDVLRQCKFSQHCCKLLKKEPSERMQAELDVDVIFKGLMASESQMRKMNFATRGYIFESSRPHIPDGPFYHVNPLQIWMDDDIWEYIRKYNVPYSPLYDVSWTDKAGVEHRIQRNGCWGCATGILYKDNQITMIRHTHPQLHATLMKKGMGDELLKLAKTKNNGRLNLTAVFEGSAQELLERRPCAFDDLDERVDGSGIDEEYDAEIKNEEE